MAHRRDAKDAEGNEKLTSLRSQRLCGEHVVANNCKSSSLYRAYALCHHICANMYLACLKPHLWIYHLPTTRKQMIKLLSQEECSARDLSQMLRIQEKEVYTHLSHIARSVAPQKQRLVTMPSRCLSCGYAFDTRKRFTKPGRCPRCRGERIQEPRYRVV